MKLVFYIYRFIDKDGNVIYIGRTKDIRRRIIKEHFTCKTHLPNESYFEVEKIEYAEFSNESEQVAYEAILINKEKPKYNIQFKDGGCFDVNLPKIKWMLFEWDYENQMETLKALKKETVSIVDSLCSLYHSPILSESAYFGYPDIDKMSLLMPTSTTLIVGASGVKKTNYALCIARTNAKLKKRVLYINLKETTEDLIYKMLSIESAMDMDKLYKREFSEDDWKKLAYAMNELKDYPMTFYNKAECGSMFDDIERVVKESQCDMVIIDDLNSISDFENSYSQDKTLELMRRIKSMSTETKCPVISILSFSKKDKKAEDIVLSDLNSNSMISYSDNIQILSPYPAVECSNILSVVTAKSNIGKIGRSQVGVIKEMIVPIDHTP